MFYYLAWAHVLFWSYNLCTLTLELIKDFENRLFKNTNYPRSWYSLTKDTFAVLFLMTLIIILLNYVEVI